MSSSLKELYDKNFYEQIQERTDLGSKKIIPLIFQIFTPQYVIDVGCGIGTWLATFKKLVQGIRVLGLDGEYNSGRLLIEPSEFIGCNLEDPLPSFPSKFDLAISLEVAEHLSPQRARSFVKELASLSDVILFSAAWAGQGGPNYVRHLNEQWHEYWVDLFADEKFFPVDWIRPQIMYDSYIPAYYKSNTLLFVQRDFFLTMEPKKFSWSKVQKHYWDHALQEERRIPPRFFERIGTRLDNSLFLTALKKLLKRIRPRSKFVPNNR